MGGGGTRGLCGGVDSGFVGGGGAQVMFNRFSTLYWIVHLTWYQTTGPLPVGCVLADTAPTSLSQSNKSINALTEV